MVSKPTLLVRQSLTSDADEGARLIPRTGLDDQISAIRSGASTGSVPNKAARTQVNVVVETPIPRASVRTAIAVNPGLFLSCRNA